MNIKNEIYARKKEATQRAKIKYITFATDFYPEFTEGQYDRTDGTLTNILTDQVFYFESKWYGDPQHKRDSTKFKDNTGRYNFQIDYDKLSKLTDKAKTTNSTPLLICFFSNELVVWDISKCNWQATKTNKYTNKYGGSYGQQKEYSDQAYLYLDEAIYRDPSITPFS